MTEQTEGAEVEALAEALLFGVTEGGVEAGRIFRGSIARRILASDWLAAREAAAEARGAQAVLAAVEREASQYRPTVTGTRAAARAAAAVTTSSAKSSDLATRVPQDESQHAAGGGAS